MKRKLQGPILTIPNILSFLRLCMIPLIVWLYRVRQSLIGAAVVLVLSGVTDIADGMIARHFHMVSDFGKALDPIADKATQGVVLLCLSHEHPLMLIPLILLIIKEAFVGITNLIVIRRSHQVIGANWHGKVVTVFLYAMMFLHLLCESVSPELSVAMVAICIVIMPFSCVMYGIQNFSILRGMKRIPCEEQKNATESR